MEVFALVGASGTGKSFQATSLAARENIQYIIDDGLLIRGNKVIAGVSAKKETTKLGAVKRALMMDEAHKKSIMQALEECRPDKILVLGTSKNMVDRICQNLHLPGISEYIHIEDMVTQREIRMARRMRQEEGKHVIPVPTFEIKKDFSGYFIHPLRIFQRVDNRNIEFSEKTVVRPTYSYLGRYYISDSAIEAIAAYNARKVEDVSRVFKTSIQKGQDGVVVSMDIALVYGGRIPDIVEQVQRLIAEDIEYTTGMNVLSVNMTVKAITMRQDEK